MRISLDTIKMTSCIFNSLAIKTAYGYGSNEGENANEDGDEEKTDLHPVNLVGWAEDGTSL